MTGMHLGELGVAHEQHEAVFGYFGTTIRVNPDLSDVGIVDLLRQINAGTKAEDTAALLAVASEIPAVMVHPDDVEQFWTLAKANRQGMQDIAALAMRLLEVLTDRPTQQPSDSSGGLTRTGASSAGASSSRALQLLDGRPDLQVAVLRAEAEKARSASA